MPFKMGHSPFRKTDSYLQAGKLVFKDRVKIMTINFNVNESQTSLKHSRYAHPATNHIRHHKPYWMKQGPNHLGTAEFVFYNVPQVQYKNPSVQIATIKNLTPTPFITCFMEDGEKVLFDVDNHSSQEILSRLIKTLGKSKETLAQEALASEKRDNPANFGKGCDRYCICTIPGQVPCSGLIPVPKHWRGKYAFNFNEDEDD